MIKKRCINNKILLEKHYIKRNLIQKDVLDQKWYYYNKKDVVKEQKNLEH